MRARSVLLIRMDGIGDALVMTPLVAALRAAGHRVGAILSTRNLDAFAPRAFERKSALERIPWPRHGSTRQSYARALADARARAYDVALVASEEAEAYRFAREAGVAVRVGFVNGWEKPLKSAWARTQLTRALVRPASAEREARHEAEVLFRLGEGLSNEVVPTRDPARLRPLVVGDEAAPHGRVVVQLTPKLERLGVDAATLRSALREVARTFPSIGVADRCEAAYARELAACCGMDLEVTPTVERWKDLIAGASAVVAPDSGAAHVAGMTGVGCVDLFRDTPHVKNALRRWYPWASPRVWPIPVTPLFARRLSEQLVAGIEYVSAGSAVVGVP